LDQERRFVPADLDGITVFSQPACAPSMMRAAPSTTFGAG
jgi:hypothetical protein